MSFFLACIGLLPFGVTSWLAIVAGLRYIKGPCQYTSSANNRKQCCRICYWCFSSWLGLQFPVPSPSILRHGLSTSLGAGILRKVLLKLLCQVFRQSTLPPPSSGYPICKENLLLDHNELVTRKQTLTNSLFQLSCSRESIITFPLVCPLIQFPIILFPFFNFYHPFRTPHTEVTLSF